MCPFSIMAYLPGYFFGSVLTFIGVDLMVEYLWDSKSGISRLEYCLVLGTWIAINVLGLIPG